MKNKNIKMLIVLIISLLISVITISPTKMNYKDKTTFNTSIALEHLHSITKEQHSVFDYDAHEDVRQYLLSTSKELAGADNVFEQNYLTKSNKNPTIDKNNNEIKYLDIDPSDYELDAEYDIRNVLVKIPGKNDTGILLAAHYDSRGHTSRDGELAGSYGAADDGYGVVTMLEVMRLMAEEKSLENSVYFLFTDAEETLLGGSILASKTESLMNNINFVINIEARGLRGPAYMFETSKNNSKVLSLYNKAKDPVSYSVAPAVYSILPNFTDFTSFTEVGKAGINFATLNDINDYHVPGDNYANVNPSSIQHYGSQILPVVKEYASNAKYSDMNYFNATSDNVFFNFLPGVFVSYPHVIAVILAILVLVLLIAIITYAVIKKQFSVKQYFKSMGIFAICLVAAMIFSQIVALYIARINGYNWSLVNVRSKYSLEILIGLLAVIYISSIVATKKMLKTEESMNSFLLSTATINVLLCVLTTFALPGASFIFVVPSILSLAYLYIRQFVKCQCASNITFIISFVVYVVLFAPLLISLVYALTVGGFVALAALAFIPFAVLIPMYFNFLNTCKFKIK